MQNLPVERYMFVRVCVCIYGHVCMLGVYLYVSVLGCPCKYRLLYGCRGRAQASPSPGPGACGHTSLQLLQSDLGRKPLGSRESEAEGGVEVCLSVCLSVQGMRILLT